MEEQKRALLKRRSTCKGMLTAQEKAVEKQELFNDEHFQILLMRQQRVEDICSQYNDIQSNLEEIDEDITDRLEFEERSFSLLARIKVLLSSFSKTSSNSDVNTERFVNGTNSATHIKLPEIQIPSFNGDYTEWLNFRDTFKAIVIDNSTLSGVVKFFYLNSSLSGEAKLLLKNITVSEENFPIAWNLLTSRYNNTRLIAHNHVSKLFAPPAFNKDSASLRSIIDHFVSHVNALEALNLNGVSIQDLLLSHFMIELLDHESIREWENVVEPEKIPTLQDLVSFLEKKCKVLEIIEKNGVKAEPKLSSSITVGKALNKPNHTNPKVQCVYCKSGEHILPKCNAFLQLSPTAKWDFARVQNLCFNCLRNFGPNHQCSKLSCVKCFRKHHTVLHYDPPRTNAATVPQAHVNTLHTICNTEKSTHECQLSRALLPTAKLTLHADDGQQMPVIALLDSASDCNLISERLVKRLGLGTEATKVHISGVNQIQGTVTGSTQIHVSACTTNWTARLKCLVVPDISLNLPLSSFDTSTWNIPPNLLLADPEFNNSKPIDIVLGSEVVFDLLKPGKITPTSDLPIMQNTSLGWVFAGKLPHTNCAEPLRVVSALTLTRPQVEVLLEKFWQVEDIDSPVLSIEESSCEEHFSMNTTRQGDGRFVVKLPRRADVDPLGTSRATTVRRFCSLEKRLSRNFELRLEYTDFMHEYLELNHMEVAPPTTVGEVYYIPHHPVLKPQSTTTRLRVVFDASAVTSSGQSLNDTLMVGPVVQQDLFSILVRFRIHRFSFVADLTKMYRQILVHPSDRDLQRIFWRDTPSDPLVEYQLKTVTYGTASASFLATRVLKELALTDGADFPAAAKVVMNDFYVDDCISGCDSEQEALVLYEQLTNLLKQGGFELRKWSSNSSALMNNIPTGDQEKQELRSFGDGDETVARTLGLFWQPNDDLLRIQTPVLECDSAIQFTKRSFLSIVASIFDPLGLVSPVVIASKILFQELWTHKLGWDDSLPPEVNKVWLKIYSSLPAISQIAVPRLLKPGTELKFMQIHGFCDSSERAFGACLYLLSVDMDHKVTVNLICAKSKVAPLKSLSLPRLELCGALLLSKLLSKVQPALNVHIESVYLWTDSTIVLSWLAAPPNRWKIFVANRTAKIQRLTSHCTWKHVASLDNPADIISRGCTPAELKNNTLWWSGPSWLKTTTISNIADASTVPASELPECRISCATVVSLPNLDILSNCSSYMKLLRIVAYCLRFVSNCKGTSKTIGPLTAVELDHALMVCVKAIQAQHYQTELAALKKGAQVPSNSTITNLHPILHADGTIRVGGRLQLADLPFDTKHQIILPVDSHFSKILVKYTHTQILHGSVQLLIATIRQRFWIPSLRKLARSITRSCVTCVRYHARPSEQLMGNLPAVRLQQTFPFNHVGVDYCGPFVIKFGAPRSRVTCKAYIALFICMVTRAIHTEVVTSLSTHAFLVAFTRFCGRRGIPAQVYSDNGTNFQGAQSDLTELGMLLSSEGFQSAVQDSTSSSLVQWHFIPPSSPHWGGLWEANIKSLKTQLKKVMKGQVLIYEELTTLVIQIEAMLNSRPLSPMTEDASDLCYLSPGHFLVGRPLNALPIVNTDDVPLNRLSRWQLLQQLMTSLWRKWSTDHLLALQQRSKWNHVSPNLKVGTLVLIMEDNIAPTYWRLGRISEVHYGKDGLGRVVTLHTSSGLLKRPIVKVCPLLPVE